MVDMTTNDLSEERKRKERERKAVIKSGDISKALASMQTAEAMYRDVCETFNVWARAIKDSERERRESVAALKEFNRNAERLMGDSMRALLVDFGDEVKPEDVNIVTDDARWTTLLARIANTDTMNALKLTKAAYKIAVDTLGGFESKIAGLKRKTQLGGATASEESTASLMLERLYHAKSVIEKRKDVIVEFNLKTFNVLRKFADNHLVGTKKNRTLTQKERDAINGLI